MDYKIIPESIIRESNQIESQTGQSDNNFAHLLLQAEKFKMAEMTPVFLLDPMTFSILCVAEETFGKKLH